MSAVRAELIRDFDALQALAPEWWELWRRCPAALPFQAPAWLIPWRRNFAPGPLFVAAARKNGSLVGLAPGFIEDGPLGRRILPLGISLSDHLDILADPDCETDALAALAAAVLLERERWDIWELEELLPDAQALRVPLPPGCTETIQEAGVCPVLSLREERGDSGIPLPRAKRRHLNLARNRAARQGKVEIELAETGAELPVLEHLFRLHGLRWRSRHGPGMLVSKGVQGFQREAAPGLQAAGLLHLYTLSIAGQVVAAHYELVHRSRVYVYLTGFDPAFEYESPSVILLAHAIERAAAAGCREVDFLRGREPYKYEWGAVDRPNLKRSIRQVANG